MLECIGRLSSFSAAGFRSHCHIVERIELETPHVFIYLMDCPICNRTHSCELPAIDSGFGKEAEIFAWFKGIPVREAAAELNCRKAAA